MQTATTQQVKPIQPFYPSPYLAPGFKASTHQEMRVLNDNEIIARIAAEVSDYSKAKFGYTVNAEDIQSKSRKAAYTIARHICMVVFYKHRRYTLIKTGITCGNRDHTCVLNALNKIFSWAQTDSEFHALVQKAFSAISISLGARLPELIQHHSNKKQKK